MSEASASGQRGVQQLAVDLMRRFGREMDGWYDCLDDEIVMEFPFGPSIGLPARVEGKDACVATLKMACDTLEIRFEDVRALPLADSSMVVVEYRGHGEPGGKVYDQTYICLQQYKDGKLVLFREYMDTSVVLRVFGNLGKPKDEEG